MENSEVAATVVALALYEFGFRMKIIGLQVKLSV